MEREKSLEKDGFQYGIGADGSARIEGYVGAGIVLHVPGMIDGSLVKVVGEKAFANTGIVSVVLPDTLEAIEGFAFSGCENLEEVSRESEDLVYGKNAFYRCSKLTSLSIPSGMKEVPQALLARCSSLVDVTIPEGTVSLGRAVFGQDYALRKIYFPESS